MTRKPTPAELRSTLDLVAHLVADALIEVAAGRASFYYLTRQLDRIREVAERGQRQAPTLLPLDHTEDTGPSAG